jgi:hypothetical protein
MHGFDKVMLVSGDRLSEVEYLGKRVGITELHAGKSPEEKLAIVREETMRKPTVYVGDGINDAPAMVAATVGLAMGQRSEVTTEAAGAVLMDSMLGRVDELLHIGKRMRRIALQSAVGGMILSVAGMLLAAFGYLPPVAGAIAQEVIDVVAVLNALIHKTILCLRRPISAPALPGPCLPRRDISGHVAIHLQSWPRYFQSPAEMGTYRPGCANLHTRARPESHAQGHAAYALRTHRSATMLCGIAHLIS